MDEGTHYEPETSIDSAVHSIESAVHSTDSAVHSIGSAGHVDHGGHGGHGGDTSDPLYRDEHAMEVAANLVYFCIICTHRHTYVNSYPTWIGTPRNQQED